MNVLCSFSRFPLTATLLLSLALGGCFDYNNNGNGSDVANVVSGMVQKGPMAGATVTVYQIDTLGIRSGESVGDTTDSNGYYEITVPWHGPSEVVAQGVYIDDVTGAPVGSSVTLQAFTEVTGATVCNLNTFSHMVQARAARLLTDGDADTLAAALASAEAAVIAGFGLSVDAVSANLDLTDGVGQHAADNAILLLFSAALSKYAGDNSLVTNDLLVTLSDDIADDGLINTTGATLMGNVGSTADTINLDTDIALAGADLPNSTDLGGSSLAWVNHAPVALATSISTDEDTASGITLAGTDADGNALTAEVVGGPANGSLNTSSGSAPLTVVYTPAANFNGSDSFTYRVNDGYTNSAPVTVSVTVNAVNDVPVAAAVTAVSTDEDTASGSITLSGSDGDGDALTATVLSGPSNGSLDVSSGSAPLAVVYTPAADFNGSDSFTYEVNDGQDGSPAVTVSLTVNATNDVPVATAVAAVTTDEDTASSITLSGSDADGDALTAAVLSGPSNGSLDVSSGSAPLAVVYTPAADFNGSDSFTYEVDDGQTASVAVTVNLTISSVNDAPVVSTVADKAAKVGNVYRTSITASDADGDTLTYASVGAALPAWATLDPATGEISGMPDAPGIFSGLQISASDSTDTSLSNTFTLNIVEPFYELPPVDVLVSASGCPATTSAANLAWTAVDGAEGYDIEVASGPAFDTWSALTSTTGTSTSWSGGSAGVAYKFRITPTATLGSFTPIQTVAPYTHGAAVFYIDVAQADDSGDGCTPATAKKTMSAATTLGLANALHDYYLVAAGNYPPLSMSTNANGFYMQGGFDSAFTTRALSDGNDSNGIEGSVLTQPGSCHTCNPLYVGSGAANTDLNILDGMTLRVTGQVTSGMQAGLFASSAMTVINNDIDGGTAAATDGGVWGIYANNFAVDMIVRNNRIVFGPAYGGRHSVGIDTQSGHLPSEIVGNKIIGLEHCGRPALGIIGWRPGNHRPTALIADNLFEMGASGSCAISQGFYQAIQVDNAGSGYINLTLRGNTIRFSNRNTPSNAIKLGMVHALIDGNTIDMGDHSAGGVTAIEVLAGNDPNITATITNNVITWGTVQDAWIVNAAIYPWHFRTGNAQISNNTIITGPVTALNNYDAWNVGIRLYQGDADGYSVSNNIFAMGDAYLGVVVGGTARRYAIEEISGAGKAGSIENNAFVDPAGTNTALTYVQNTGAITSVAALNALGSRKDGNIMLDGACFVDPASDYRLAQNSLADQDWWNVAYGGKDTSQSTCHASASVSCGNVVDDLLQASRSAVVGSDVPDNTDASGYSMGAIEY